MRYQILLPMILLQCVNLFWYWNIWRIIITSVSLASSQSHAYPQLTTRFSTIVFKKELDDDRSEHGDDDLKEE